MVSRHRASTTRLCAPHHDGSPIHVSDPTPGLGDRISVFLRTPRPAAGAHAPTRVWVRTTPDGDPRYTEAVVDRRTEREWWWRAEIEIRNPVTRYRFLLEAPGEVRWCTGAGLSLHDGSDAHDFTVVSGAPAPAWAADAVVYQIFPDRFARSAVAGGRETPGWAVPADWADPVAGRGPDTPRQLYGGDLDGLRQRLDHVAALGANVVYLTPIFPARSNHRYDASSFTEVDPVLGGNAAYARLCDEIHRRGWHVVGDLTLNHVGDHHPWFRSARADPRACEREMFYFDHGLDHGYEAWAGVASLPKLNWHSRELRRRMLEGPESVVRRWLRPPYRQDGWRIDVANMVGRRGADDLTREVAAATRSSMARTRRPLLLVAEHSHDAGADLAGDGWHATMNYAGFTYPVWSWLRDARAGLPLLGLPVPVPRLPGTSAVAMMQSFAAATPWASWSLSWNLLGSHDTARVRSVVPTSAHVEVAAGLMVGLPGVPMIFAGDEIGLTGTWGEDARTPMPWDHRDRWDLDTLRRYRGLIALRHAHPALREGGHRWAAVEDDAVAFLRESAHERLLVLAARGPAAPIVLPTGPLGTTEVGAVNVYGGAADLVPDPAAVVLPADGPTFQVWRLPDERDARRGGAA